MGPARERATVNLCPSLASHTRRPEVMSLESLSRRWCDMILEPGNLDQVNDELREHHEQVVTLARTGTTQAGLVLVFFAVPNI